MANYTTTVTSTDDEEMDFWIYVAFQFSRWVIPGTGVLGLVFNTLSVLTVLYMGVTSSAMVYMLVLALGDSVSGFVDAFIVVGLPQWGFNIAGVSSAACKVVMWLNYATTFFTQYVLVLFTFDRFLAVVFPIKYKSLQTRLMYPVWASAYMFVLQYSLTAPNLYIFELEDGVCKFGSHISAVGAQIYFHYTASFLYCGLPAVLLFSLNIAILIKLRNRSAKSVGKSSKQDKNDSVKSRERAITRVLLIISTAFLVFTFTNIFPIYMAINLLEPKIEENETARTWYQIILYLAEFPAVANVSFNFVFYILSSQLLRESFMSMMKCSKNAKPIATNSAPGSNK